MQFAQNVSQVLGINMKCALLIVSSTVGPCRKPTTTPVFGNPWNEGAAFPEDGHPTLDVSELGQIDANAKRNERLSIGRFAV